MADKITKAHRRDFPLSGAVLKVEAGNVFPNARTTDKKCDPNRSSVNFGEFTQAEKEY